jgi:molybdopterin converting factor small subunit
VKSFGDALKDGSVKLRDYVERAAQTGALDDRLFAVDLSKADAVDAAEFFDRTELVKNLEALVRQVLRRVSQGSGNAVYLLDTVMGGGKSHTLVYLYLLFQKRSLANSRRELRDILRDEELGGVPDAEVVVFDGMNADPSLPFEEQPNIARFFEGGGGKDDVARSIEAVGKPVVFLVDEVLAYLAKRKEMWVSDLAFIRTLAEAVADTANSVFVATVPSDTSNQEGYKRLVAAFKEIKRKADVIHPQNPGEDFARIARKQIFKWVDGREAEEAAEWARRMLEREGYAVDEKRYAECYPFHPMLIKVFTERFAGYGNFQKTRDALKLLAWMCARSKSLPYPFIGPGDVDLDERHLRDALTSANTFEIKNLSEIVSTDILPAKDHKRRALTALYLYSLYPKEEQRGLDRRDLFEALLPENVSASDLERLVKDYIRREALYLEENKENGRFYFKEEVNIHALVRREAENIGDVTQELVKVVEEFSKEFGEHVSAALDSSEVYPEKLNLVFTPLEIRNAEEYADKRGFFGVDSRSANAVVVVYPSEDAGVAELEWALKQNTAVEALKKRFKGKKPVLERLNEIGEEVRAEITAKFCSTYTSLLLYKDKEMKHWRVQPRENTLQAYAEAVKQTLMEKQKAYFDPSKVNLELLFERLLGERSEVRVEDAYENIARSSTIPYLPRSVFAETLRLAVQNSIVGLADTSQPPRLIHHFSGRGDGLLILSRERKAVIEQEKAAAPAQGAQEAGRGEENEAFGQQAGVKDKAEQKSALRVKLTVSATALKKEDVRPATLFLEYAENAWRISREKDGDAFVEVKLSGNEGSARFKAVMDKVGKVKSFIEAFANAFEGEDHELTLSVNLREDLAKQVEEKLAGRMKLAREEV